MSKVYTIRANGTSFIQKRIGELRLSLRGKSALAGEKAYEPVYFEMQPTNAYDPGAIGIYSETDDSFLGWVGKNDSLRESIRTALFVGEVHARADINGDSDAEFRWNDKDKCWERKVWRKFESRWEKWTFGISVQFCVKGKDIPIKDRDDDPQMQSFFRDPVQKRKRQNKKYKDAYKRHHKGRYSYREIEAIKAAC